MWIRAINFSLNIIFICCEKGSVGPSKHCSGLVELNKLKDLRGKIEIKWAKDATLVFKAANLKGKQHLSEFELTWNLEGDDGIVLTSHFATCI